MATKVWLAHHIYYHEHLGSLINHFIDPLVDSMIRSGAVDSFFFIFYHLGGPHIRLRLRCVLGRKDAVAREVEDAAARYFMLHPSTRPRPAEEIRKINQSLIAADPFEVDDNVYPDNSVRSLPFEPELQRYGGAELMDSSLDLFAISSVEALRFHDVYGQTPRPQALPQILRLVLRQAFGLARGGEDLVRLLGYGSDSWGTSFESIGEKADSVFVKQREVLEDLLCLEIDALGEPGSLPLETGSKSTLTVASRYLSDLLESLDPAHRYGISASHLHMTVNRLGIGNAEEVYASRLLERVAEGLKRSRPRWWNRLNDYLANSAVPRPSASALSSLLPLAFETYFRFKEPPTMGMLPESLHL